MKEDKSFVLNLTINTDNQVRNKQQIKNNKINAKSQTEFQSEEKKRFELQHHKHQIHRKMSIYINNRQRSLPKNIKFAPLETKITSKKCILVNVRMQLK